MIRRDSPETFTLITQHDHALLAGELAMALDPRQFEPLSAIAVQGIRLHDAGWPVHDDQPTLNPEGKPLHVFEIPMRLATRVWSMSADIAQRHDPYAGLLVSLHILALSTFAMEHGHRPDDRNHAPHELFELNKFQHREIERQESLRRQLDMRIDIPLEQGLAATGAGADEDRLRYDFRLLQAMDRISLDLCCTEALFPTIDRIQSAAGAPPTELRLAAIGTDTIAVSPWPFAERELSLSIPSRRIPARRYETDAELQMEYAKAPIERLSLWLVRMKNGRKG